MSYIEGILQCIFVKVLQGVYGSLSLDNRTPACILGQDLCPLGDGVLVFNDTSIASETCEELFTPDAPHIK